MIKRHWHRRFILLSMLAMLGVVLNVPVSSSVALAMGMGSQAIDAQADAMPCHKPAKPSNPCPDCPQKHCQDMSMCLAKCFQQIAAPRSDRHLRKAFATSKHIPVPSRQLTSTLVPPLLRPPSI